MLQALADRPHGYNAMKSLPAEMLVKESSIPGAGRGVFTGQFSTLHKDTIYGPYEGLKIYSERDAHQSGYCWQVNDLLVNYLIFDSHRSILYKKTNHYPMVSKKYF